MVVLVVASETLFWSVHGLASGLGIAPFVMGVFALSLGTTLPEISFGVRSAFSAHGELSLGDVVGSSVVNACGILGLVVLIAPISHVSLAVPIIDGLFYMALVLFFYFLLWEREATRVHGTLLMLVYAGFAVLNFILN